MADITISKLKIRRGTDAQRRVVIFDQGEPIYTTDTKRLIIGTGTLSGGIVAGSKIHPPLANYVSLQTLNAEVGDIVSANNKFYQLTAANYADLTSWVDVGLKIEPKLFNYDTGNKLTWKCDAFQGDSTLSGYNATNSLSSLFNGSSTGTYVGSGRITKFTALSSDGTTVVNLSSAGFISFEGIPLTVQGQTVTRFAIPIFIY